MIKTLSDALTSDLSSDSGSNRIIMAGILLPQDLELEQSTSMVGTVILMALIAVIHTTGKAIRHQPTNIQVPDPGPQPLLQ